MHGMSFSMILGILTFKTLLIYTLRSGDAGAVKRVRLRT